MDISMHLSIDIHMHGNPANKSNAPWSRRKAPPRVS